ncbi:hypothetical protein SAY86_007259 [Trapa natans]|uniref:Uncharacterized protein n=1 Tax=Trapa natans TaxID=22666 RepID=A0AAN7R0B3_TRANT|nr:hypothetical protein SAY86_007259 [Trapa natans]
MKLSSLLAVPTIHIWKKLTEPWIGYSTFSQLNCNRQYEMRLNMKTGLASQKKLSVPAIEFPKINESYACRSKTQKLIKTQKLRLHVHDIITTELLIWRTVKIAALKERDKHCKG